MESGANERKVIYRASGTTDSSGVTVREDTIKSCLPQAEQRHYTRAVKTSCEPLVVSLRVKREIIPFDVVFYEPEIPRPRKRVIHPDLFA